jgi:hypothetical protein
VGADEGTTTIIESPVNRDEYFHHMCAQMVFVLVNCQLSFLCILSMTQFNYYSYDYEQICNNILIESKGGLFVESNNVVNISLVMGLHCLATFSPFSL